ncbi:hypothetical protein WN943_015097 [Citrus x changshan-huyou]
MHSKSELKKANNTAILCDNVATWVKRCSSCRVLLPVRQTASLSGGHYINAWPSTGNNPPPHVRSSRRH